MSRACFSFTLKAYMQSSSREAHRFFGSVEIPVVAGAGVEPAASWVWAKRVTNYSTPRFPDTSTPLNALNIRVTIFSIMYAARSSPTCTTTAFFPLNTF